MATQDEINIKQLPTFSNTKPFQQLAITLRAEGQQYEAITNTINAEYGLAYKQATLRGWFMAGGNLEQAFNEYNEAWADMAVANAKMKIKKITSDAADTLAELMTDKYDGRVRQQAAKTVLGKYVPDRQILIDESKVEDVPDEIGAAGDKIMNGEPDGQDKVDDAPKGESTAAEAGAGSDKDVPPGVLPEQPPTS